MRRVLMAAVVVSALLLGGCGGGGSDDGPGLSAGPSGAAFPVTVGSLTLAERPERIVSLAPTATEMLFAIGAGPQVVAVDDQSTYPADAPRYYYEIDQTLYFATSKTFIGSIFALFGLTNVADAADPDGAKNGYPQLSPEALVAANPDLIFLADSKCCGQSPATVRARKGWSAITAVEKGQIVALDDDIASRWGPRVVDLLRGERGLTVLATMHDLTIAGEYADRMVLLAGGRVVAAGTAWEVLTEELLARHYRLRVKVIDGGQGPLVVPVRN